MNSTIYSTVPGSVTSSRRLAKRNGLVLLERALLYLTLGTSFIGAAVLAIPFGPIYLFPARILLIPQLALFGARILTRRPQPRVSFVRIRFYLQFLVIWGLYATFSILWALDKQAALVNVIFLWTGIAIILFQVYYLSEQKYVEGLFWLWVTALVVMVLVGLWEALTLNHLPFSASLNTGNLISFNVPTAFFYNPNDFASCLALAIPFFVVLVRYAASWRVKCFWLIATAVAIYILVLTQSRSSFLGLVVGIAFWLFAMLPRRDKVAALAVGGLIVLGFAWFFPDATASLFGPYGLGTKFMGFFGESGDSSVRLNLALNVPGFLVRSLGLGVGAGNAEYYTEHFGTFDTRGVFNLHNWWLEILANYGFLILVGYLLFYFRLSYSLFKCHRWLRDPRAKKVCEALLIGLIGFPLSSLSSSSILSLAPQWMFFGSALAFLNAFAPRQQDS